MTEQETTRKLRQDPHALVEALADLEWWHDAAARLCDLGAPGLEAVREGLCDGRWQVRRACVLWLWRYGEPEGMGSVVPLLRDPRSKVRATAVIAIGHARHGHAGAPPARGAGGDPGVAVEPLLLERICEDESIRVRRHAMRALVFQCAHPQLEGFFQKLLDEESDAKLHKLAGIGLAICRQKSRQAALPARSAAC